MKVKIKKLIPEAVLPTYKHIDEFGNPNDMGMDITCTSCEYDEVYDRYIYHTGLAFKLPQGYGMLIFPRSSNSKTESYLTNSVGILDSTYTGELVMCYKNRTAEWQILTDIKDHDLRNLGLVNEFAPYTVGDKVENTYKSVLNFFGLSTDNNSNNQGQGDDINNPYNNQNRI